VLGPDGDRVPPDRGRWLTADRDHDRATPGQARPGALRGCCGVEHHQRGIAPERSGLRGIDRALQLAPGGSGEPQQRVEQVGVGHHDQASGRRVRSLRQLSRSHDSLLVDPVGRAGYEPAWPVEGVRGGRSPNLWTTCG
jgi:hypothetical protein